MTGPERKLCTVGLPTHGHYEENGNYGGPGGTWGAKPGPETTEVAIANVLYAPGDLSMRSTTGSCKFPCLGETGAAFPLADGTTSAGRPLDIDSAELGIGTPRISAPKQRLDRELPVTSEAGYRPGETVTYLCRVHPFMRGAFEVKE